MFVYYKANPHLFFLQDGLLLKDFDSIELVIAAVTCQKDLAEAALADDLKEVEV